MNNNTTKQTAIPVNILTGYKHENRLEETRQKIEKSAFYLQTIFNSIKTSARFFEGDAEGELQLFCGDLMNLAEVGYALADSVWASTMDLTDNNESNELTLAEQISLLINNPKLPVPISEALQDGVMETLNASKDKSEIIRREKSPEFIAMVLRGYKEENE